MPGSALVRPSLHVQVRATDRTGRDLNDDAGWIFDPRIGHFLYGDGVWLFVDDCFYAHLLSWIKGSEQLQAKPPDHSLLQHVIERVYAASRSSIELGAISSRVRPFVSGPRRKPTM